MNAKELVSEVDNGEVSDFDASLQKLMSDSFNKGVDFITRALIDTFRGMAFRDNLVPRVYTATDVVKALKVIHADVKRERGEVIKEP